jgi:SAM-dependent methyltransferase
MFAANEVKPIIGNYLNIGKQSVLINRLRISKLVDKYGLPFTIPEASDQSTRKSVLSTPDDVLLAAFSTAKYHSLDKSDYETAEEIVDLNLESIPVHLEKKFDFIYDGGTLDNVFSPAQSLKNLSKMLRPGGRLLNFNVAAGWPGAYCSLSCEWFFSYYAVNNFASARVYLAIPTDVTGSWPDPAFHLFSYSPYFTRDSKFDPLEATRSSAPIGAFVLCIAELGEDSTVDKIPAQSHYIEPGDIDWREKYHEYKIKEDFSLRFDASKDENMPLPFESDHYKYLGVLS